MLPFIFKEINDIFIIFFRLHKLQAVVQSQQLRRETETMGPNAELSYWRRLLARFSSIIEHIKTPYSQTFINFLINIKSKHIRVCLHL